MFIIILCENQNQFRLGSIFGKKSSMHNVVILVKSIFNNKHNHYYQQVLLEKYSF